MNKEYIQIQTLRDKLQKRFENFKTIDNERLYHNALIRLFNDTISKDTFITEILNDLTTRCPGSNKIATDVYNSSDNGQISQNFINEIEHAATAYQLLFKFCTHYPDIKEARLGYYFRLKPFVGEKEGLTFFTSDIVQPFHQYLDEQLEIKQQQLRIKERDIWVKQELSKQQTKSYWLLILIILLVISNILLYFLHDFPYNLPYKLILWSDSLKSDTLKNFTANGIYFIFVSSFITCSVLFVNTIIKDKKKLLEQDWDSKNNLPK